ncbi:MAG TPA: alpha/beta hydrolase [Candidatus Gallimonas intestinigallinarum]|uniref:Alpha/beta hydrolase n=1 Tax=Candidatus Gallimonas intestinigallinarum TaxID=2838604 RepID=A0A9D2IV69_9FIRM|nr:alpha/beta hydrolase [Candidatus Gallimonas intestinigallinarum]
MRTRYPIDRSFGIFSRVSPPFGRGIFALARAALSLVKKGSRGVSVRRVTIAGKVPVRAFLISPKGEKGKLPCLVYFHGGGFVFKAAGYHYRNAAAYAWTGCRVLFVDYRLAPNYPCPAPNEDCFAAYAWAAEHADAVDAGFFRYAHVERAAEQKNVAVLSCGRAVFLPRGGGGRQLFSADLSGDGTV